MALLSRDLILVRGQKHALYIGAELLDIDKKPVSHPVDRITVTTWSSSRSLFENGKFMSTPQITFAPVDHMPTSLR
jgi:hypothetical protein|tara:strand:- start:46 stop:273 length:228 start_codon:yes stop_codon:yes gene_type:complete